jgi:lipoprotein-releasing system permease protein
LPGTIVSLTGYAPRNFAPRARRFLVAGYFKTGLYELDSKGILMDRAAGAEFLGLRREDGVELASGLRVAVQPGWEEEEGLQRVRAGVEAALARADVFFTRTVTWREERAALLQAVRVEKAIMTFIIGMVVLFSAFMIFIILTLQVVEKTRDLGVLQSVGATPGGVARIFLVLGMVLCLAGAVVGTVYGLGFAAAVNTIQRWIKLLTGVEVFSPEVYYLDRIPVRFAPRDLAFIIGLTVLVGLLASLIPALRAARKDPVVALRYE